MLTPGRNPAKQALSRKGRDPRITVMLQGAVALLFLLQSLPTLAGSTAGSTRAGATGSGTKPTGATNTAGTKPPTLEKASLDGLAFRSIGPAVTGGRVIDIEVNPRDHSEYYAASGHGSLWKTTNAGVTFSPVFDGQSSFPIGAVTLDP
jgi:hypothetical protein